MVHVGSSHLGPKGEVCLNDRIRETEEGTCWRKDLGKCLKKKKIPVLFFGPVFSKYTNHQLSTVCLRALLATSCSLSSEKLWVF